MSLEPTPTAAETALLHYLVRELGGHSVTIVREKKRLLGWSTGRMRNSLAMADLIEAVDASRAGEVA